MMASSQNTTRRLAHPSILDPGPAFHPPAELLLLWMAGFRGINPQLVNHTQHLI